MAAPLFSVQPGDGLSLYRQIVEQAKAAIASGRLRPGDRLPTHRDLARELVVAPLTVKKAYDLLQAEGLIRMTQGRGTFVLGKGATGREARRDLAARAAALARQARLMGLTAEEIHGLIERHWHEGARHGELRR
jgi:GntR family transcriptional regulator